MYGAHCSDTISGTVAVVMSGPIRYVRPAAGALTPSSVSGDTIFGSIADFSAVNIYNSFNITVVTDSFAFSGLDVCFNVSVLPAGGDVNPANNNLNQCFMVRGSFDPNEKEAILQKDSGTSQYRLTYTIYFQNTGTDTARNISILDTIDTNLDISSLKILHCSNDVFAQVLSNRVVKFNFQKINLTDSATNKMLSQGFVQFMIKPIDSWTGYTPIQNTAYITFDLNAPVKTNVTSTSLIEGIGSDAPGTMPGDLKIYPNPSTGKIFIATSFLQPDRLIIYDINGQKLVEQKFVSQLDVSNLLLGIYLFEAGNNVSSIRKRFVKF